MAKIPVQELRGAALDWAAARAAHPGHGVKISGAFEFPVIQYETPPGSGNWYNFSPHTDTSIAARLLHAHITNLRRVDSHEWEASMFGGVGLPLVTASGLNPNYAIARCVVRCYLGDDVDIPEKLLPQLKKSERSPMDEAEVRQSASSNPRKPST
jgi:hypothetical protein